jgi:hypothetical protein
VADRRQKYRKMSTHDDRDVQDQTGYLASVTIVLSSSNGIDNWSFPTTAIAEPESGSQHAAPPIAGGPAGDFCELYVGASRQLAPDAAAESSWNASSNKKIKPGPKTLGIIRLIQRGLNNNGILTKLPDETVENIRTVRSRFNRGKYVI